MDFRFFDNYPSRRIRFLRSHDTLSLFLHDIMTCMHISKKYNEIHGGKTNLTIRNHAKILTTPSQITAKISRFYRYSRFHSFQAHSESILCIWAGTLYIENTRWVSFNIKFTRQGFENACWHREACRAMSTCVLKAEPGKLDIKRREPGILFISLPIVKHSSN